ncbi:hypothetical protein BJ165DRAFT_1532177 [Panaeolus papilionaceus]|nr:hypothetical protein BJ165DRAFT_1532177 [Panaeolus papilionaceus]
MGVTTPAPHPLYDSESFEPSATRYCYRECQMPISGCKGKHQDSCEFAHFNSIITKALRHPKILHHIRVAIITDGQLLRTCLSTLGSECHNVTFHVSFDPSDEDREKVQAKILAPFSDSVMPSPEELKLPPPDKLDTLHLTDGFLYFRCGLSSGTGLGNINPSKAAKIWALSKERPKLGGATPNLSSQLMGDRQRGGGDAHPNPIVIANWCWSGSSIWVTNAIEITPEAIRDAQRGYISEDMRLCLPGDEGTTSGPLKIPMKNSRSGLLSIVNEFIKNNTSLGLTSKLTIYDKQVILDMIKSAHNNLWERFRRMGSTAFDI